MKKSARTYLLLGAVLVIWGVLGFRIVKTVNPPDPETTQAPAKDRFQPMKIMERDTFSIAANYRDPFLGTIPKSKKPSSAKATKGKQEIKPKLPEKNITYSGFVNEKGSNQKIFFITVDGQQLMLSKNQQQEGVKLVSGNDENIRVRYNGLTKIIKRNQ